MAAARPDSSLSKDALEANARLLETVLQDFGVRGTIGKVRWAGCYLIRAGACRRCAFLARGGFG